MLYLGDEFNNRIRAVGLPGNQQGKEGQIWTVAGNGCWDPIDNGDGGLATHACIGWDDQKGITLSSDNDGNIHIGQAWGSIRRIDKETGIISTWQEVNYSDCGPELRMCRCQSGGCPMAWSDLGHAFFAAQFCGLQGEDPEKGTDGVIVRWDPDGVLTHIAGRAKGLSQDGVPAVSAMTGERVSGLILDPAGNLYFAANDLHTVRRVDVRTGHITTVAGLGESGQSGDYGPAAEAGLDGPWALGFTPDDLHLLITEEDAMRVRMIWQAGQAYPWPINTLLNWGNGQEALLGAELDYEIELEVFDWNWQKLTGVTVSFQPVSDGAAVVDPSPLTATNGVAGTEALVGMMPGVYEFVGRITNIHGEEVPGTAKTYQATAVATELSTIFTLVNESHVEGSAGIPGPASMAQAGEIWSLALAGDGPLYLADRTQHAVYSVTLAGHMEIVAGTPGSPGELVELLPATEQPLNHPTGLLLDEAGGVLYIAEDQPRRIIAVGLPGNQDGKDGLVWTFAGNCPEGTEDKGDHGPALNACLGWPQQLSFDPNGDLYIGDSGQSVRKISMDTGIISTWLPQEDDEPCEYTVKLENCGVGSCPMAWTHNGDAWISGTFCNGAGEVVTSAITKRTADGTLEFIGGSVDGQTGDGIPVADTAFSRITSLWLEDTGNILLVDYEDHRIRRIHADSLLVTTVAGTGEPGSDGEYGPANAAQLDGPGDLVVSPDGHLYIGLLWDHGVRVVW